MTFFKAISFIGLLLLGGCTTQPVVELNSGANNVRVAKSDPASNYAEIGPISAADGEGCGVYGYRGTYERTIVLLKNKAYLLGGDYVQIYSMIEPHLVSECFRNKYTINGTLYKKTSDMPSPLPITNQTPKSGSDKLKELKNLLDEHIITQQEYDLQKKRILDAGL